MKTEKHIYIFRNNILHISRHIHSWYEEGILYISQYNTFKSVINVIFKYIKVTERGSVRKRERQRKSEQMQRFTNETKAFFILSLLLIFDVQYSVREPPIWKNKHSSLVCLSKSIPHSCTVLVKQIKLLQQYVSNFM